MLELTSFKDVALVCESSQENDGAFAFRTQGPAHVKAARAREHYVQDRDVFSVYP